MFIIALMFADCSGLNAISLKCVSVSNQECKVRLAIKNIDINEPSLNKCNDSYNNILRANETRHVSWHKTCVYKFRLGASVCNGK